MGAKRLDAERPHGNFRRKIRINAKINPDGIVVFCSRVALSVSTPKRVSQAN